MCCVLRNFKYFTTLILFFSELSDSQTYGAEQSTIFNPLHKALHQSGSIVTEQPKITRPQYVGGQFVGPEFGQMPGVESGKFALRSKPYLRQQTSSIHIKRTIPEFKSRPHYCDYMARHCLHSFVTGKICARTIHYDYGYQTFDSYCMMEYVNCRENYEVWQIVHTGACFNIPVISDYIHYPYHDDFFMDMYYVIDDRIVYD